MTIGLSIAIVTFSILVLYFYWRFFLFFRDPERIIPDGDNVVSPADGTVIYVKKVEDGLIPLAIKGKKRILLTEITKTKLPSNSYYAIGIFMHPTSVHVNRSPIKGEAQEVVFTSAKNRPMTLTWWRAVLGLRPYEKYGYHITQNERNTIFISGAKFTVIVVQIADIFVSKVQAYIATGDKLEKGQRIGRIVFGSQVDLILPAEGIEITTAVGCKVLAGNSVIAKVNV